MGLFDFMKKKEEDIGDDFGGDFGDDFGGTPGGQSRGMPGVPGMQAMGSQQTPQLFGGEQTMQQGVPPPIAPSSIQFSQPPPPQGFDNTSQIVRSSMEVLSSKLDSLKAAVDRINERLDYIEKYFMRR